MVCPQCAANMSETAKACGYCGTRLQAATPTIEPPLAVDPAAEPATSPTPSSFTGAPRGEATVTDEPASVESAANAPATVTHTRTIAAPATSVIDRDTRQGTIKGSLRWVAVAGLVVLAILAIDMFGCSFGLHEDVSGDGLCGRNLAAFWMFIFAPATLLAVMMRLGSHKWRSARLGWQALVATTGVALSIWAVIFYDATYHCAGRISGGPYPESDSTYCAIEWGRVAALIAVGLVFVVSFVAAIVDRNRRKRL